MHQPTISVVIPLFNRESLILETLESVRLQSRQPFETIVVDDNSTDDSHRVVDSYPLSHQINLRLIQNTHRKGPSGAKNCGIEHSLGDYIAFLDSDDLWTHNHLERLSIALSSYTNAHVAFSAATFFGPASDTESCNRGFQISIQRLLNHAFSFAGGGTYISNTNLLHGLLTLGFPLRCPAMMARRDVFCPPQPMFDEDIMYTEDAQWAYMASASLVFLYINTVGLRVRRHRENDRDRHYLETMADSYDRRFLLTQQFFHTRCLTECELRAVRHKLCDLQSSACYLRSQGMNIFGRITEAVILFRRIPSAMAIRNGLRIALNKQP